MHQYTRYLLAFGLAVSSAMAINPCNAQTLVEISDNSADNKVVTESISNVDANQSSVSKSSANSSANKSVVPSDAVSQADGVSKPINPRIPISSRIFPSMQQ
jgi:hypothetical protein